MEQRRCAMSCFQFSLPTRVVSKPKNDSTIHTVLPARLVDPAALPRAAHFLAVGLGFVSCRGCGRRFWRCGDSARTSNALARSLRHGMNHFRVTASDTGNSQSADSLVRLTLQISVCYFNPVTGVLATGSADGSIRLWDTSRLDTAGSNIIGASGTNFSAATPKDKLLAESAVVLKVTKQKLAALEEKQNAAKSETKSGAAAAGANSTDSKAAAAAAANAKAFASPSSHCIVSLHWNVSVGSAGSESSDASTLMSCFVMFVCLSYVRPPAHNSLHHHMMVASTFGRFLPVPELPRRLHRPPALLHLHRLHPLHRS